VPCGAARAVGGVAARRRRFARGKKPTRERLLQDDGFSHLRLGRISRSTSPDPRRPATTRTVAAEGGCAPPGKDSTTEDTVFFSQPFPYPPISRPRRKKPLRAQSKAAGKNVRRPTPPFFEGRLRRRRAAAWRSWRGGRRLLETFPLPKAPPELPLRGGEGGGGLLPLPAPPPPRSLALTRALSLFLDTRNKNVTSISKTRSTRAARVDHDAHPGVHQTPSHRGRPTEATLT